MSELVDCGQWQTVPSQVCEESWGVQQYLVCHCVFYQLYSSPFLKQNLKLCMAFINRQDPQLEF